MKKEVYFQWLIKSVPNASVVALAGGCPTGCIKEDGGVYVINAAECIDCGSCAGNCPTGAIKAE